MGTAQTVLFYCLIVSDWYTNSLQYH